MEFSNRGVHTSTAWRDWQRRNVDIVEVPVGDDPTRSTGEIRVATEETPSYHTPTSVLDAVTVRAASRIDGSKPDPHSLAIVDVATDDCGQRYLLSDTGAVFHYDRTARTLDRLECRFEGDGEPRSLAVSDETLYVARDEPSAVYAYSRISGQLRWVLTDGVAEPVTFVPDGDELYLLDRGGRRGGGVLNRVVSSGRIEPVVTGLYEPVDADVDEDGSLYVLEPQLGGTDDENRFLVRRIDRRALEYTPVPAAETVWIPPDAFYIRDTGESFVPSCLAAGRSGEVLVGVAPESNSERWVLGYLPDEAAFGYQVRFRTGCRAIRTSRAVDGRALLVIDGNRRLFAVEASEATRPDRLTGRYEGSLRTRFDAGVDGTRWHRLRLDLDVDTDTAVRVHYRAVDAATPVPNPTDTDAERGDLQAIDGIGSRKAWRLRRAGVMDLADLVDRSPETISRILSVEEIRPGVKRVRDWQRHAETLLGGDGADDSNLEAVDGIGPVRGSRLRRVGITTLSEFVSLDAAVVSTLLTRELRSISTDRTAEWIETARDLLHELPAPPVFGVGDDWKTVSTSNPQDVLLEATGRYLWVQLDLVGTEHDSPTVSSVDASYPRKSYLRELPAVYRENERERATLERFLALFEGVFTDVDAGIDDLTRYLDPMAIPADSGYLEWLGGFLATDVAAGWPTAAKREFIDSAPDRYRKRGTRRGLEEMIELYLDHVDVRRPSWERARRRERNHLDRLVERGTISATERDKALERHEYVAASDDDEPLVRIVEHKALDCIDEQANETLYSRLISCPEGFLVLCHPALDETQFRAIGRIVGFQRPAHTSGRAVALRQRTVLSGTEGARGFHTYLGINTELRSDEFELETATLGRETRLGSREPHATLGVRSRLDDDARLS